MSKKIILRSLFIFIIAGVLVGGGVFAYMFFMPHRNIQESPADYQLSAQAIVTEYLKEYDAANEKYLDTEGESKILEISGVVHSISTDFNNQKVVLLKKNGDNAGVSCTFTALTNASVADLQKGQTIKVKGVIRSGATFDEDLKMYENVILEKCSIIPNHS